MWGVARIGPSVAGSGFGSLSKGAGLVGGGGKCARAGGDGGGVGGLGGKTTPDTGNASRRGGGSAGS
jgi:hypothetical protein